MANTPPTDVATPVLRLALPSALVPDLQEIVLLASATCGTPTAALGIGSALGVELPVTLGMRPSWRTLVEAHGALVISRARAVEITGFAEDHAVRSPDAPDVPEAMQAFAGVPLHGTDGRAVGMLCVGDSVPRALDDTQRQGLESLARVASRLIQLDAVAVAGRAPASTAVPGDRPDAVGRLASSVAHDFNNLLIPILCSARVLSEGIPADDPLREDALVILDAAERASALTRHLLTYARSDSRHPRPIDISAFIDRLQRILERMVPPSIQFVTRLTRPLGQVQADPRQMEQVVMNLVVNARDAMPEGGRLVLATDLVDLATEQPCTTGVIPPGAYVVFSVGDTGTGMTPEVRSRLFEPFFTTKAEGKGTGIGLSMVSNIVAQGQGHLVVDSAPGRGTTVSVYLPRLG